MTCDYHGLQVEPTGGESRPCGICGTRLYQQTLINECPCGHLFGVTTQRKWIGDAWVIDPADAAHVRPVVEEHVKTCQVILGRA